uniref:Carboxylic ester hydrolase n=1 Tax=Acrobeloides nanus TaxID=290746 RepID=A0A914EM43_9BILA
MLEKLFTHHINVPKSEDCLYLNVFAPSWKPKEDQPNGFAVMFWIHGGGFAVHSAAHYGDYGICKALCTKDVIVVTINYRLGFFGFLATGDEHAPGNYGLWDQTLALKWVKENISAFGGDPNNITVFGQSAGGMSTDILALSPHSRDLFQKMIPMSGTACCSLISHTAEHVRNACLDFAIGYGFKCPVTDRKSEQNAALVEFFRKLSPSQLAITMLGKRGFKVNVNGIDLTPIVDGDFLPRPIDELRKEAPYKICMTGVTENEGVLFVTLKRPSKVMEEMNELITVELTKRKIKNIDETKKKLLHIYCKNINVNNKVELKRKNIDLVSDVFMNYGTWEYAHKMAKNGHIVYQYLFEYVNLKGFGILGYIAPMISATHSSDLPYLFLRGIISKFSPNETDLKMVEILTTYFTNFAKFGNPNGQPHDEQLWQPLSPNNTTRFFKINFPKSSMEDHIHNGRMEEWNKILSEESSN